MTLSSEFIGTHICMYPEEDKVPRKTRVWVVEAKSNLFPLGRVKWFSRWRKYAFFPAADTVFEETCLEELADFCKTKTTEHRAARKVKA